MAKARISPLHPLFGDQAFAVAPDDNVWLSASAGTGKTQVLTARVLRLLLRDGVAPEDILCLTFTKAGAAEMANRVRERLAAWVRMPRPDLALELKAIGAPIDPKSIEKARTLFASLLDAPGGGLRIMTIHSFCQTLLASFPEEAGIAPRFQPMEERDAKILAREALSQMLVQADAAGERHITDAVARLSARYGEDDAEKFLLRCANVGSSLNEADQGLAPRLRQAFALPETGTAEDFLREACCDGAFDEVLLRNIAKANRGWRAKTGQQNAQIVESWLAAKPIDRFAGFQDLLMVWSKEKGRAMAVPKQQIVAKESAFIRWSEEAFEWSKALLETAALIKFSDFCAEAITAGQRYQQHYAALKRTRGLVDFDDLIRQTANLLIDSKMHQWIRYKLDQRTDHILVDEAQDTNPEQWSIIAALTSEFFAGEGASGDKIRTLFTVGDFKQAIFSFQGTSPRYYKHARERFSERAEEAERGFLDLGLERSFRSVPAILDAVDAVIEHIGHEALELSDAPPLHVSHFPNDPGQVTLWEAVSSKQPDEEDENSEDEENWVSPDKRELADAIAKQIARWLDRSEPLMIGNNGKYRPVEAGDIMILVRSRSDLALLIVARLFARNIPVAGIDRFKLDQPLVVQDLLSAIRFVQQPEDDLNLAALLVSPLVGWSHQQLDDWGYRGTENKSKSLWRHLRETLPDRNELEPLYALLAMADFSTPYGFLERILSGPMQGRAKIIARMTHEAVDPINELLNAAFVYQQEHLASLQGFLDWFDRGAQEIKRELSEPGNAVRLLTVHGAKGLQAPVVILADATSDPDMAPPSALTVDLDGTKVPLLNPNKDEQVRLLADIYKKKREQDRAEHWRLLYVAMTRAENHLFITGSLSSGKKGKLPPHSWYVAIAAALAELGSEWREEKNWGQQMLFGSTEFQAGSGLYQGGTMPAPDIMPIDFPEFFDRPAPPEALPPRPLTPSRLAQDDIVYRPDIGQDPWPATRGRLLHQLFERLPEVAPEQRYSSAEDWLLNRCGVTDKGHREEIVATALSVIGDPQWSALFSQDSLAEAPISAVVGGMTVFGTIDRLLVEPDQITILDFKTGITVPNSAHDVPRSYWRQMAAYAAAIAIIFPEHRVKAALLYTAEAKMIELPSDILDTHKPDYQP